MTIPTPPDQLTEALSGNFELLQEIGRGGMGIVYAARDIRLDRLVAIKVLPELVSNTDANERFLQEARAAARLSHPSIVPIYAADERNGVAYIVMSYVDGPTLSDRIRDGGALSESDAVPILCDIAHALHAAHARGVIHRDIKPENVLVDRSTGRAMVTDFGIARIADVVQRGARTRTGQVLGTVAYMSPEQVTGGSIDGRSDLYSLGVLAYEALSGKLPFDGPAPAVIVAHATRPAPPLASVAPGVSAQLCAVVDRCLRKDPADRYGSGDALASAFEHATSRELATTSTSIARVAEERVLTEKEAERVWQRAAELQAGIGSEKPLRAPTAAASIVPRTATSGFLLEHVRAAAIEAGISAPYVTLALDELLKRKPAAPLGRASVNATPATITTSTPVASRIPNGPMVLIHDADLPGELLPQDFDIVAANIKELVGGGGIATALGRTLSWTPDGRGHKRVHISITMANGRTRIHVSEHLGQLAGTTFGPMIGPGGAILTGLVMITTHHAFSAAYVLAGSFLTAYAAARYTFNRLTKRRDRHLADLTQRLAAQIEGLISNEH